MTGARQGRSVGLRRLLAGALAYRPAAFILPGLEIGRAYALDLEAAGLRLAATPRHAEILLIVGPLPEALAKAAVVVYAQMVRPRMIVALDAGDIAPLPPAHITDALSQAGLQNAAHRARELLRTASWAEDTQPFEGEGLVPKRRQPKPEPASAAAAQDGRTGHAGQVASTSAGGMEGMAHSAAPAPAAPTEAMTGMGHGAAMAHDGAGGTNNTAAGGSHAMPSSAMGGKADGGMQMGGGKPGGDMAGMGFMSMVRLTQNQPRSADGLPMEWVQTPLGPFFTGLPSGLDLTVWLDGDTVARAKVGPGLTARGVEQSLVGDVAGLPDRLACLDPLAPAAYRVLAMCALEAANKLRVEWETTPPLVAALEHERIASHLSWLAAFGYLLGFAWMEQHAARLHRAVASATSTSEVAALQPQIEQFLRQARRAPLLERRLRRIGTLEATADDGARGPVARASGRAWDARSEDPCYTQLGFQPAVAEGGDALARFRVRLEEIAQSLRLLRAVVGAAEPAPAVPAAKSGRGAATVETPRGAATLAIVLEDGIVREARLDTPTAAHLKLIDKIVLHQELGDALVGVASLDLSPWETKA